LAQQAVDIRNLEKSSRSLCQPFEARSSGSVPALFNLHGVLRITEPCCLRWKKHNDRLCHWQLVPSDTAYRSGV